MFELPVILTLITGVTAFVIQFAGLIWRIAKAESNIYNKLASVEHEYDLEIERVREEILQLKLYVSETYIKKDTLITIVNRINEHLIRLEEKIDRLNK